MRKLFILFDENLKLYGRFRFRYTFIALRLKNLGSSYIDIDAHKVIIGAASPFFKTCFLINSDSNLGYRCWH